MTFEPKTSSQKFIWWFQEFYSHEFLSLSKEFKNDKIHEILSNNAQYITKEEVMNFDACNMCGRCCEAQGCLDFDIITKQCTRHENPIHELCKEYPWTGEMGIAPLLLDCHYQVAFFVNFFDKYFQKIIDEEDEDAS